MSKTTVYHNEDIWPLTAEERLAAYPKAYELCKHITNHRAYVKAMRAALKQFGVNVYKVTYE